MTRFAYKPKRTHLEATKQFASVDLKSQSTDKLSLNLEKPPAASEAESSKRRLRKKKLKLMKTQCYHCRKQGHLASECPSQSQSDKCCYLCGSTAHSLQQCRKYDKHTFNAESAELKFAKCFICQMSGHLSSQCPQNPNGCYPNGGQCRYCQSKRHLAQQCPQNPQTLQKMANSQIGNRSEIYLDTRQSMKQGGDDDFTTERRQLFPEQQQQQKKKRQRIVNF